MVLPLGLGEPGSVLCLLGERGQGCQEGLESRLNDLFAFALLNVGPERTCAALGVETVALAGTLPQIAGFVGLACMPIGIA